MKKLSFIFSTLLLVILLGATFTAKAGEEVSWEDNGNGIYTISQSGTIDDFHVFIFQGVDSAEDFNITLADPGKGNSYEFYLGDTDGKFTLLDDYKVTGGKSHQLKVKLNSEYTYYACVEHASSKGVPFNFTISNGKAEVKKVASLSLNKTEASLKKGKKLTLKPTVTNKKNPQFTWKSSNKKVATVKNGKVTAKGYGTTTITCFLKGTKLKASCKITVAKKTKGSYSDIKITQGVKGSNVTMEFLYAGGQLYGGLAKYTLTTGNFSGDLPLTFYAGSNTDTQTLKNLKKNSTYIIEYTYGISGGQDQVIKNPDQQIPNGMGGYITIPGTSYTVPAPSMTYDASICIGDIKFEFKINTKGTLKTGGMTYYLSE